MNDFVRDYESRLLRSNRVRAWLHLARFRWAARQIRDLGGASNDVFELGCFNGMLIDHIDQRLRNYVGVDANWEGGLDQAKARFDGDPARRFEFVDSPDLMDQFDGKSFDFSVCLETIEHVPPDLVDGFLAQLARVTSGYSLITVPNEIGPVFAGKYLAKRLMGYAGESYSVKEFFHASLGDMKHVNRDQHKGFDYRKLIQQINRYFKIEKVRGLPMLGLPAMLSFGVSILARPLERAD